MIKIIADNKIPFLKGVLEPFADIRYVAGAETTSQIVQDADVLITRTRTKCNEVTLKGSKVKMIATATIGYDHIDTAYCAENEIKWTNAAGCNAGSVKQYVASALATLSEEKKVNLKNKTIGIVGVGNVGSKIEQLAKGLGMKVLLNDPPRAEKEGNQLFVDLEEIVAKSDIITFHVPLQREGLHQTFHIGNTVFFEKCKKDVIIINSSRGEVINNEELLLALNKGLISEAIIDVWENEPSINLGLLEKVFITTPHIAGYSVDGKANGTAMSVQAISKFYNIPLKEWYPDDLPCPEKPEIHIDVAGLSDIEVFSKAILHTYNILKDDKRMRNNPESFEQQRGSYPMRREFGAYRIILKNGSDYLLGALNKIGFEHVQLI